LITKTITYRVLVGKTDVKRPLGRPKHRGENNIKMDFKKWDGARAGLMWLGIGAGDGLL
jgi:hypothetical protein